MAQFDQSTRGAADLSMWPIPGGGANFPRGGRRLTIGFRIAYLLGVEEKRPLRWQPEDHHFWSLIMLAVTAGAFLLVTWVATKALFLLLQEFFLPLARGWLLRLSQLLKERKRGLVDQSRLFG
jgi:hypothetical protein